ncbi:chromatin modification- protein VID21 [Metarhizium rileyi]|uniref:Vacuolar import and degradation protein 21 n=1 Tax=Metarhizium rileyi (strain RCEF 4871) TaxID=1649241 RepID=A0A5C6G711_METRR|nr:chromatin modification- protein VID21 [Metarhizium rileyi]
MTEVAQPDLSRLLQLKRNDCNAIVTSRKRKLRELFAVATQVDSLPNHAFANPDAPAATPAEWQFLQANDILQGKPLNEQHIPARQRPSIDKLKRSLALQIAAATSQPNSKSTPVPIPIPLDIIKKENSALLVQQPTDAVSVPKNVDSIINGRPSSTTGSSAQATPSLLAKKSLRSPTSSTKPAKSGFVSPSINEPAIDVKSKTNGVPTSSNAAVQQQPPVKLPPGTKEFPSNATKSSAAASRLDTPTPLPARPTVAASLNGAATHARDPSEAVKAAETMSSPASTTHTATTPAIHDVSADTSPDNDSARFVDPTHQKRDKVYAGKNGQQVRAAEDRDQSLGAEDRLLQESIRSSTTSATPQAPEETAKFPSDDDASKPDSRAIQLKKQGAAKVANSQAVTPEHMDVVSSEPPTQSEVQKASSQDVVEPRQSASQSPVMAVKKEPTVQPSAPERAVTRVSSGALRLKSVTEIVGGGVISRASITADRDATKGSHEQLTPVTSTPQSPASRIRNGHKRDRSKGQVSTVLFGKQPKRVNEKSMIPGHRETLQPTDDYYTPLFVQNFTGASNWMQPIERILFQANKTIATPDANLVIQDQQACRVLRRVYHLQQHDKWSLRQLKRCPEPTRPPTQWDTLLKEMKWMRTDFREERKWKMAVARNLAYACAEWHEATPGERRQMQVSAANPSKAQIGEADASMVDVDGYGMDNQPTPDLVSSGDVDSPQPVDELTDDFVETVPPSAIFTLQEDDVVFGLRRTTASDALLDELPMYGSPLEVLSADITNPEYDPDAHWRRPALPLSKYVEGEMKLVTATPPRKRSKFNYENEESDDEREGTFVADQTVHNVELPPTTDEVALFRPDSKHIRDRLHAGHQFRPPSEHPMPVQSFYESRGPSQWTLLEDDELRGLVREYSYNWSLISNMLSAKSRFHSGAERRTPWECFERWINLEGLPADMQKTQYFKSYNNRIETAQRIIAQQNQIAAQQATAAGGAVTPVRRRPSVPLRVERRRNQKHLTLIDAMRKLAKKRETAIQKQQHSASQNAANKKTNETIAQRQKKTPRDYSLLRYERDQALAEKMAQYAQRQEAQRRAALQARAQGQTVQAAGAGAQAQQNANHLPTGNVSAGAARPAIPSQLAAAAAVAAQRPRMPMQTPVNGVGAAGVQAQMNGGLSVASQMTPVQQAQLQAVMQGQQRMPIPNQQPDANLMLRAQRISEQQRVQIQQAAQQQHIPQQPAANGAAVGTPGGQHSSPPLRNGISGINQQNYMATAQAVIAQYSSATAVANGHTPPPGNGLHMPGSVNGSSPGQRVHPQLPASIAAQLAQIEAQLRVKNPNFSPEQARQVATEHLTRTMMAQRQSAMNAAAGGTGQPGLANSIAATTSPHQYAALLRQQQQAAALQAQQQAKAQHAQQRTTSQVSPTPVPAPSPARSHQRQSSGSATPSGGQ